MAPYTPAFYDEQREGSWRSATVILPLLFEAIPAATVVDVGCGIGTWLGVARSLGKTVLGMDGDYVERAKLEIPPEFFLPTDVSRPIALGRRFDLALCLEVGEHLPAAAAQTLVDSLTALSDVVAFSAAIPHQGGNTHVNEQWQSYWAALFANRAYVPVDFVRSQVWHDDRVEDFYAQNLIVYCSQNALADNPELRARHERAPKRMFDLVHPKRYLYNLDINVMPTRKLLAALPAKIVSGVLYRLTPRRKRK